MNLRRFRLLISIVTLHLILLALTRFTLWPEMVVYPYLINNGYLLYRDIINPYPPLLSLFLAHFAKFFGYFPPPYQILTFAIILLMDLLIYFIALKSSKSFKWAALPLLFFTIASIPFGANGLWFDLVQTPLVILGFYNFYLFLKNKKQVNFTCFAFLFLVAFLIKQQAVWLLLWFIAILIYQKTYERKNFFKSLMPAFAVVASVCMLLVAYIVKLQIFGDFLFWVISFPFTKASSMPGYILLPTVRQTLTVTAVFFISSPIILKKNNFQNLAYLTAIVLVLFAYPRFDYFHLIPSLALLAISLGYGISDIVKKNLLTKTVLVFSIFYLSAFSLHYIRSNWQKEIRFFENDIIVSTQNLTTLISNNSLVYIQNGPDQLLPLAGRLPPKPWADEFPWYLEQKSLQDEIVLSLKREKPEYIISRPYEKGNEFDLGAYQPVHIVDYIDSNYKIINKLPGDLWLKVKY